MRGLHFYKFIKLGCQYFCFFRLMPILAVLTILLFLIQTSNCVLSLVARIGWLRFVTYLFWLGCMSWIALEKLETLQVWDAVTGAKQYTFEGHEAPVYSVCPHHKENIQVINNVIEIIFLFIFYFFLLNENLDSGKQVTISSLVFVFSHEMRKKLHLWDKKIQYASHFFMFVFFQSSSVKIVKIEKKKRRKIWWLSFFAKLASVYNKMYE